MRNAQLQQKICEQILAGMNPLIRAYHTNRWTQTRSREAPPPRDPEKVYAEFRRRNKPFC
jgi:hypothetical protein